MHAKFLLRTAFRLLVLVFLSVVPLSPVLPFCPPCLCLSYSITRMSCRLVCCSMGLAYPHVSTCLLLSPSVLLPACLFYVCFFFFFAVARDHADWAAACVSQADRGSHHPG